MPGHHFYLMTDGRMTLSPHTWTPVRELPSVDGPLSSQDFALLHSVAGTLVNTRILPQMPDEEVVVMRVYGLRRRDQWWNREFAFDLRVRNRLSNPQSAYQLLVFLNNLRGVCFEYLDLNGRLTGMASPRISPTLLKQLQAIKPSKRGKSFCCFPLRVHNLFIGMWNDVGVDIDEELTALKQFVHANRLSVFPSVEHTQKVLDIVSGGSGQSVRGFSGVIELIIGTVWPVESFVGFVDTLVEVGDTNRSPMPVE